MFVGERYTLVELLDPFDTLIEEYRLGPHGICQVASCPVAAIDYADEYIHDKFCKQHTAEYLLHDFVCHPTCYSNKDCKVFSR